jgi:hypothetical protein
MRDPEGPDPFPTVTRRKGLERKMACAFLRVARKNLPYVSAFWGIVEKKCSLPCPG